MEEEDGSLEEVEGAERLMKDWTGVGGVCLTSFLETYKQIKILSHSSGVVNSSNKQTHTHPPAHTHTHTHIHVYMRMHTHIKVYD